MSLNDTFRYYLEYEDDDYFYYKADLSDTGYIGGPAPVRRVKKTDKQKAIDKMKVNINESARKSKWAKYSQDAENCGDWDYSEHGENLFW